jgi:pyruvate dehydrogenase E1 component beta subunit
MSEEMRHDESIYLMGEEVAEYNGAYKASKGMLAEFEKRVIDTLLQSLDLLGAVGSAMNGCRTNCRIHDLQLLFSGIDKL